jgi:tetratricopeptide (TPR) repeat protein
MSGLSPANVEALVGLALAKQGFVNTHATDEPAIYLAAAEAAATKALELAPNYPRAHLAFGSNYVLTNRAALGAAHIEQAIALDQNHVNGHAVLGFAKIALGRAEETEDHVAHAFRPSCK